MIPTRLPVVTYSDGEGTGGIGISIYRRGEAPRAAYMVVHREIRRLWESQLLERTPLEQLNDIFAIECVGPLAILATWGEMLVQELWLHFIDNAAAQQALVKGRHPRGRATTSPARRGAPSQCGAQCRS